MTDRPYPYPHPEWFAGVSDTADMLYRAVVATPTDPMPRLALADALDEAARPLEARFLRTEAGREPMPIACDGSKDGKTPCEVCNAIASQHCRCPACFAARLRRIAGEQDLAGHPDVRVAFDDGLYGEVSATPDAWFRSGDDLQRLYPLRRVHLTRWPAAVLNAVRESGWGTVVPLFFADHCEILARYTNPVVTFVPYGSVPVAVPLADAAAVAESTGLVGEPLYVVRSALAVRWPGIAFSIALRGVGYENATAIDSLSAQTVETGRTVHDGGIMEPVTRTPDLAPAARATEPTVSRKRSIPKSPNGPRTRFPRPR